ncbi:MAG: hypothetical protein KAY37_04745 [Phycisphaerae bacterium]|nr:hypothetical protein [Phycisphaerae bacterium]
MKSNRAKIILVVALFVVAFGVYWFWGRSPDPLSSTGKFKYVCVATGKVFTFSRKDIPNVLPGENPDTHEYTLLPVDEREGKLYVIGRYAGLLDDPDYLAEVNKYVHAETLEVLNSPR